MTNASRLTDAEFTELDDFLAQVDGGKIPNAEALDGFFAALGCCPDLIGIDGLSLPGVCGGAIMDH